jgi:hypothetical protein
LSTRTAPGRPQRAKARRNSACTAATGTVSHFPWGENLRPQDGAATLINDAEPADTLARLQADEFFGIDLPDVVGPPGPVAVGGGAAALGSGAEAGLAEPALHGALRGQPGLGVSLAEDDADEASPPGGVGAAQRQGLLVELLGGSGAGPAVVTVGGGQGRVPVLTEAAHELPDGAWGQAEGLGDGGGGLAAVVASQDGLAEGDGSRCWHGKSSRGGTKPGCGRQHIASAGAAKPKVAFNGKTQGRI